MLLWLLFILVSCLFGLYLSLLLDIRFFALERAFFAIVLGHAISIWLVLLLACFCGRISTGIILLVICALVSVIIFIAACLSNYKPDKEIKKESFICNKYTLAFFALILLYLLFMNLYGVLRPDESGNLYAFHTVWADYPFHTSIITSLVYSHSFAFPPVYPQFLNTELHYPFLMDFYSAVLMKAGLSLRAAIIIPNIIFQYSLFGLLFFLAYRLTELKKVGALAVIIFIFSGYPPGLQPEGIHFLNPMYAVIMPQRTAMLGMAISFAVYILLYEALFRNPTTGSYKELFVAAVLIGLLPYIHAHSFMATAFVSVVLVSIAIYKNAAAESGFIKEAARVKPRSEAFKLLLLLFAPLIMLSLPQVLYIRTGVSDNFFVLFPGWTEEISSQILGFNWSLFGAFTAFMHSIILVLILWVLNLGILFLLMPLGLFKSTRNVRTFYVPFLLLFVIANLVKFQPWYFDNYKIFLHWYALTVIVAAVAIFWIYDSVCERKRTVGALALIGLVISCVFFGFGTHVGMLVMDYQMWSCEEIGIANWVRDNTASDSVFLTGSAHNHPIPALAGRQRVLGYEGWLWSHGIKWTSIDNYKRAEIEMYKGNYTLIRQYGVDYICIGPYERGFARDNHFAINQSAFEDPARFNLIFDTIIKGGRWSIYEVTS